MKNCKILAGILIFLLWIVAAVQAESGLVGEWKFDDGSENIAADSSGNANNGTINGRAAWTSGITGSALIFDGANDYVDAGNAASLNPASAITLTAWIKTPIPTRGWQQIIDKYNVSSGIMQYRLRFNSNTGKLYFSTRTGNVYGNTVIQANTWYFVAATYNGTNLNIYLNGLPDASQVSATGTMSNSYVPLRIGYGGNGNYFLGTIDEVRIYNRALTASEILVNYQAGNMSSVSGVVISSSNTPISGATVVLNAQSAASDASGNYTLSSIPAGTYSMTAAALEYQTLTKFDVAIVNGQANTVNFSLSPVSFVPDIYDDFSDGKYQNRTGSDPWGRPLPEWTVESGTFSAVNGYLEPVSLGKFSHSNFSIPTNILNGTWIFRYKYPNGTPVFSGSNYTLEITAQYNNPTGLKPGYASVYKGLHLKNPVDGHWWIDYEKPISGGRVSPAGYIVNMVGSQIDKNMIGGNDWHEVVFIKDQNDFIYSWLDGKYVRWSTDKIYDIADSIKFFFDFYDYTYNLQYPIVIDDVRVYRDQYLPPNNLVIYDPDSGNIVIKGRGITLAGIAVAINNPAIFSYNASTNTATAYKDILVDRGAELRIENEKLLMSSAYDGERKIKYYTDAIFNIKNSTIDSTNNYYYLWQRSSDGDYTYKNTFRVINSTINNFGGIYFEKPVVFYIENSNFTNLTGSYPINVYFRWPPRELKIKNSVFRGKTGTEKVKFHGGNQFNELSPKAVGWDIIDSDLSQVTLECVQDSPYYLSPGNPGCAVNIINTKLGLVTYSGTVLRTKYYLDVKIVDSNNIPVHVANVTVTNEIDDLNYPSENLLEGKKYFQLINQKAPNGSAYFEGQTGNWINGWADVNDYRATSTEANGHTLAPSNAPNTLVITEKESTDSGITPYTYKITAEKNGKIAVITGLNIDETWYRTNPNQPVKTVVLNIDTGTGEVINTNSNIDINLDGVIDIFDLRIVALHFGETTASPYPRYDVNADGIVDILDIRMVAGGM